MMIEQMIRGVLDQNEVLCYYNATITYENLPKYIYGFVDNYKGINIIFINKNLSCYKKKKTLLHELAHIELNHLNQIYDFTNLYIEKCEDEADIYLKNIKKNIKKETTHQESSQCQKNI